MKSRHFPAEWASQDAILLTWPHPNSAWADSLERVTKVYLELVSRISHYQDLLIQLDPSLDFIEVSRTLQSADADLSKCHFISVKSDDTWARDHGPLSVVVDGEPLLLNFEFNGWGNKFESTLDNALNQAMHANAVFFKMENKSWVLEGGSVESDGDGTLLTTEACLLNPNRNPSLSKKQITTKLKGAFGCQNILWLQHGALEGDDTDAHVDTLARFAPNRRIVFQGCDDERDAHYPALQAMKQELSALKNVHGEPYKLTELPLPQPIYADDGHRLPSTYANFLVCNDLIVVPIYEDPADAIACQRIQNAFPDHILTAVDARPLIEEHGSIHCITMQLHKGTMNRTAEFLKT